MTTFEWFGYDGRFMTHDEVEELRVAALWREYWADLPKYGEEETDKQVEDAVS
jgi:hypothetical protein